MERVYQRMLTNALSHERLTPLNSIINMTELVLKKCNAILDSSDQSLEISSTIQDS